MIPGTYTIPGVITEQRWRKERGSYAAKKREGEGDREGKERGRNSKRESDFLFQAAS